MILFTDFFGSGLFPSIAHIGLESASFVSLIEFGRKGLLQVRGKSPGPWIYLPYGVVLLFAGLTGGIGGLDAFSRYALGVTACAWGGIVLIAAADALETGLRRQMRIAGIAIALLVVPVAVSPGNPSSAGWDHINFASLAGIPTVMVSVFTAALSACATLALWEYSCSCSRTVYSEKHLPYPIFNKVIPLAMILTLSVGWVFTHYLGIRSRNGLLNDSRSFVTNFSSALGGVLSEIDHEAQLLSGSPPVIALLSGGPGAAISAANSALDRYSKASSGLVCYVLDNSGKTIASSNRDRPDSFVGKSYAFHPYFKDAISGKPAWYFALGVNTGERGYYAGVPVRGAAPDPIGVAVIKKPLADSMFHHPPENICMVIDPHGVIFLSGRKDFLFRTLWSLPEETRKSLIAGKQFGPGPFTPLLARKPANEDKIIIKGIRYFTTLTEIEQGGWSIVYLYPTTEILIYRLFGMSLTFVICSIIVICHIAIQRLGKSATEVARSHVLLESSLESTADGILVVDQEGKIEKYNRKFADMWGGPEEILAAGDASKVVSHISGQLKNRDVFLQSVRKLFKDTSEENLSTVEFTDGRVFEYYSIPKQIAGRNAGRVWSIRDITERERTEEEREKLRGQLLQSQKMEAIGKLAGGVAHDFNNMLTAIDGYSELLLSRLGEDSPLSADVMEIRKAGDRAAALTRQLLAFSRMQVLQPKVLDLNDLVANIQKMLVRLIGEHIELLTIPGGSLGRVKADAGQIEQVLLNLVVNARDALPKGGRITIETSNETLDSGDFPDKRMNGRPGPYVMLAVADNGTGMDEKTMERIFEPFFTTKEKGKGTGLGLATVYGIVKQSGGYIWVNSKPGQGTTFKIYLPRVDEEAVEEATRPSPPAEAGGTETVLVVEDMEMVRTLVHEVLTRSGYTVLEATNGGEALALCGQRVEPIHLLLTDMIMPGMTGTELAARLRPLRPGIKVLFMSGYTEFGTIDNAGLPAGSFFIQKPFTTVNLARKIRETMDS
ncbi:MAG: ATP-binding protein [Candidatus Deferrimicrobiota bacterium]